MRSASKRRAASGLVIGLCPFARGIKAPGKRIRLYLAVPLGGYIPSNHGEKVVNSSFES